ncbi:hypothetical protein NOJ05_13625 [Neorhizobium galegae]|uniref:hypothetical protein n=1 Tax=Neorhizobium galegae TaxID=399 RepID=UPI002104F8C5|nr:hypothetical protein [Neorhizobium galegae]MCQ1778242.1 hypothetical protein [Neorhizobium galegae]MCQ1796784.1 hypothetical protein [Neorhizobium galegae]
MFRNICLILILSTSLASCQTKPAAETVDVPTAAAKCADTQKKSEPKSRVKIATWTRSETDVYLPSGPLGVGVDKKTEVIELPYVSVAGDRIPGQAWRQCMLTSGVDTTKLNLKL